MKILSNIIVLFSITLIMAVYAKSQSRELAIKSVVAPAYPAAAKAINASGSVTVEIKINTFGEVEQTKALTGHPLLRGAAEESSKRWRFFPANTTKCLKITFIFHITSRDETEDKLTTIFTYPYQVEVRSRPAEPIVYSDSPSNVLPNKRGKKRYK